MVRRIEISDPQFSVPVVSLPSPGTAQADAIGALTSVGETAIDVLRKREQQRGQLNAAVKLARLRRQKLTQIDEAYQNGAVPDGYTQQVDDELSQDAQGLLETAEGPTEKRLLELGIQDLSGDVYTRARAVESAANVARDTSKFGETVNDWLNIVAKNPGEYGRAQAELDALISTRRMPVEDREKLRRGVMADLAEERVYAVGDPEAAITFLDNAPDVKAQLPPERQRVIVRHLESQEAKKHAQYEQSYQDGRRAKQQAAEDANLGMVQALTAGDKQVAEEYYRVHFNEFDERDREQFGKQLGMGLLGGDVTDRDVYADLIASQARGENVVPRATEAYKQGKITGGDYNTLTARAPTPEPWYEAGQKYIAAIADGQGKMDFGGELAKKAADAQDAWRSWASDHPEAPKDVATETYRKLGKALSTLDPGTKPTASVSRQDGTLDIEATKKAIVDKFKVKHEGNVAAAMADPDLRKEMERVKSWEDYQASQDFIKTLDGRP